MLFRAEVTVKLKNGILDPEATTIRKALQHLGYDCQSIKQAAVYELEFRADSSDDAVALATKMSQQLLANPIIHDYEITLLNGTAGS
ncbi:MAG: phosphoribosylformylglycinamidine synthase subunit PurS [Halobacteriota archaeon]